MPGVYELLLKEAVDTGSPGIDVARSKRAAFFFCYFYRYFHLDIILYCTDFLLMFCYFELILFVTYHLSLTSVPLKV